MSDVSMSRRINALFDTFHNADEPAKSNETLAAFLTERGHSLAAEDLELLRSGGCANGLSSDVVNDIASFFRYPSDYLTAHGSDQRFKDLDEQLDTLRVLRQQGVKRLRFRGQPKSSDRAALIRALRS